MSSPPLSFRRFYFLDADEQEPLPPGRLTGKLREVAGNLWFRLPDPRPPDASFTLVVQCVEPTDAEAGWYADELDRIVAEVWLTEGLDEATRHIIASESGPGPGRAVTQATQQFAAAARPILAELEAEDPVAGATLRARWEAWWKEICADIGL